MWFAGVTNIKLLILFGGSNGCLLWEPYRTHKSNVYWTMHHCNSWRM